MKQATEGAGVIEIVTETNEEETADAVVPEAGPESERNGASSLTKMLSILDLFTPEVPVWSTTDIIEVLETSRSTGYRYIKALNSAGLISAVGNGYYMLGSRIIELDFQIRRTDPLLQAANGVLEQLVDATGHSALLCMHFQNAVLCIDELRAPLSPTNLFTRGQRRPLFRGAISKVILAHLPSHRLRAIFERRTDAIREAKLGQTWSEFRETLAQIRSDGFVKSVGEFNPGVVGIAAPIFNVDNAIIGSIGIACGQDELRDTDLQKVKISVKRAGREVTQRMSTITTALGLPPRAVG
ncbi:MULTISPECIES: IclR family transcriptional regulator [unclassified Mesorhizobium]|uniref:IclR family transcriptional regulator n=1 Tax=unclassified Mesorhizobium TaxID=325217 RepID=UPI000FD7E0E4|nr:MULTISPECIES: IclR family transcriptional regulator [unclassified Mesorhizobium]TGR23053.1 IclR family transcriptional regulator [Mesorhizobium sp. M8A.F.Ca.ET.197.01.1.1]TGR39140.1 IclR family transcriptional regulator [bacterium M00.F.Ca.ET.199.01.1.1]TGR46733.1 IclR family transcriptional regulator [Mesorhizobium sp. M8A.F.Ca.ET.198.01.1.1]TGV85193.1 IclR family transcriptional regulator [Mesorhizobium sp. M00.F.Ca.ET.149.01.1.1]